MRPHRHLRDLVLSYEELDPAERQAADEHLAHCARCRDLLARVRGLEQNARPAGALPPIEEPGAAGSLIADAALRSEAAESAAALRDRLGLASAGGETRAGARARRGDTTMPDALASHTSTAWWRRLGEGPRSWLSPRVLAPLAAGAVLVLLVLSRAPDNRAAAIRGLAIAPASEVRGGESDSVPAPSPGGRVWRTGEAFVLRFALSRNAHPIVIHLGPSGRTSLLHPADLDAPVPRMLGDTTLSLPSDPSAIWTFEGETGRETFIVSAASRADLDLRAVLAEIDRIAAEPADHTTLAAAVRAHLERSVGPSQILEVTHVP